MRPSFISLSYAGLSNKKLTEYHSRPPHGRFEITVSFSCYTAYNLTFKMVHTDRSIYHVNLPDFSIELSKPFFLNTKLDPINTPIDKIFQSVERQSGRDNSGDFYPHTRCYGQGHTNDLIERSAGISTASKRRCG